MARNSSAFVLAGADKILFWIYAGIEKAKSLYGTIHLYSLELCNMHGQIHHLEKLNTGEKVFPHHRLQ